MKRNIDRCWRFINVEGSLGKLLVTGATSIKGPLFSLLWISAPALANRPTPPSSALCLNAFTLHLSLCPGRIVPAAVGGQILCRWNTRHWKRGILPTSVPLGRESAAEVTTVGITTSHSNDFSRRLWTSFPRQAILVQVKSNDVYSQCDLNDSTVEKPTQTWYSYLSLGLHRDKIKGIHRRWTGCLCSFTAKNYPPDATSPSPTGTRTAILIFFPYN